MVDEAVGSLGSAIAGGTNLSGSWDMPITKGLQLNQQDEFKRMQAEAQAIERDRKRQEAMSKYMFYDDNGKWNYAKNAKAFGDYYQSVLPKLEQASKNQDVYALSRLKNEIATTAAQLRTIDRDEAEIFKPIRGSVTRNAAQKIYQKEGIDGIMRVNEQYPFAPIAQVDEDNIRIIDVDDPKVDKVINQKITEVFSGMPTLKRVGYQGSQPVFEIDKKDPQYLEARNAAVMGVVENEDLVDKILYTQDFRNFYDENVTAKGKRFEDIGQEGLTDLLEAYVLNKFENVEKTRTKSKVGAKPSSGSGSKMGIYFDGGKDVFTFSDMGDGIKKVDTKGTGSANPAFTGNLVAWNDTAKKNLPLPIKSTFKMLSPEIKYLGDGTFRVIGRKEGDDAMASLKEIIVDAASLKAALSLNDKGLEQFFGYKAAPTTTKPAAAKATKKPANKNASPANKWKSAKRKSS